MAKSELIGDRKTLLLGLGLGNFAGLLLLCGGMPLTRRWVEAAFPYSAAGYYAGDFLVLLSLILGAFIFPAVLASLAKRLYALWGLLPSFLLMPWLAAGCTSAHRLTSLIDPPWVLPVAMTVCWAAASFPISAFRFLRQRRKRTAAPNPIAAKPAQSLIWGRVCLFAPLTLLLSVAILGWHNLNYPEHFSVVMQPHWLSGNEARVPLVKRGTGIYAEAWLNDQKVLCKIDTGADSVEWSRGLRVEGRPTRRHGQSCDLLGDCVAIQTVVLPRLKIGSYEVTNIPTEMSDAGSGPFTPPLKDADELPLLGNPVFVRTVLTIDYKDAVMTIRPAQYDFSKLPRNKGDRVLEMGWSSKYAKNDWQRSLCGTPAIKASLGAAPFWCTLDTGAGGSEICLTQALLNRSPSVKAAKHDFSFLTATSSSAQVERFRDLDVRFRCSEPLSSPSLLMRLNALVTPTLDGDEAGGAGVIGMPLMQRYRVTIDYGRGRVLLEPYAKEANQKQGKPKQEKQRLVAKLTVL